MSLHESAVMYLETIYVLAQSRAAVRSVDVAEALGYSRPSVSRAVGLLKNEGYLLVDKEGSLTLTEQGSQAASKIYERHTILTSALMALGLDRETAAEDACRMEHVISDKAFAALKAHMQKFTAESQ